MFGGAGVIATLLLVAGVQSLRHPGVTSPAEYQPLTDLADYATSPVLSRDGRMLAFIRNGAWLSGNGQIWLKMLPDGEPVQLTNASGPLFAPAFTPDGARVAYTLIDRRGESWDTWTVPITGGEPTKFLPNASGLTYIGSHEVMFSEFKTGIHLGIVTATDNRSAHREIYWPVHERAMAHFSSLSPDRKSVLVVEMDGTGSFQRCRLVPFDGGSAGAPIGPPGACTSAAWSADGGWAYLAIDIAGHSHLWRQRIPSGEAQQITFGPTDEETVFTAADGRSLLASVGTRQHTLWLHEERGERLLTRESNAYSPWLSADARRVYFLANRNSAADTVLSRLDVATGIREMLLPGFNVADYDVSPDEQQVVFSTAGGDASEIWLAPLDRHTPPKLLVSGGDSARFGGEEVFFRRVGKQVNYVHRIKLDGNDEVQVLPSPIDNFDAVSPDGKFVIVDKPVEGGLAAAWLIPVDGRPGQQIGRGWWPSRWSRDGKLLYIEIGSAINQTSIGRTVAVHIDANGMVSEPILPVAPDAAVILHAEEDLSMAQDPSVYVYVKTDPRRNIYRIPLH
jgi:Tol biopolymer transport system component